MQTPSTAVFLLTAALAFAAPLGAQDPDDGGFSFGIGVGAGYVRVSCDICQRSRDLGPSAYVRLGTSIQPGLRVAAEATAWTHEVEEERENLGAAMAVLYLHPRQGPLYVKGGLGYVAYRAGDEIAANGLAMQLGAGYELRLGRVGVSNYINMIGSSFGSLKNENTTIAQDVSTTLLQFGVALTLR